MTADDWRPGAGIEVLRLRARLNATIRTFFAARDVLEVETPVLSAGGVSDPHIDSFTVEFRGPVAGGDRRRWMRTSPEYPMKRLLAAGVGDCYELGRVFRDGEAGARHNPEFTMLEWYRVGWNHRRLMDELAELVQTALALVDRRIDVERISYRQLFVDALGLDPHLADAATLQAPLAGFRIDPQGLTRDDWLDLLLSHLIQPQLRRDRLLLLHDYPASQCALARIGLAEGVPVAERFEAFLGPLELANGYHELADADEQRARFMRDLERRRQRGAAAPALDERLLAALQHGLPDCAGVALGVDRLLAAMHGSDRLPDIIAFGFDRA